MKKETEEKKMREANARWKKEAGKLALPKLLQEAEIEEIELNGKAGEIVIVRFQSREGRFEAMLAFGLLAFRKNGAAPQSADALFGSEEAEKIEEAFAKTPFGRWATKRKRCAL